MEEIIERVIRDMKLHLGDLITIDDMARSARFSKFHFSRVFQRVTGVSPGRYLSALRLNEAKRLLIETSLSVTDISHRVGYTSVGTFTTRFTNSVGISPTTFRRYGGFIPSVTVPPRRDTGGRQSATVRGEVRGPSDGLIFLGLFPGRIPQGTPVSCTVLDEPGSFVLENVPPGSWYLLAHATREADLPVGRPSTENTGSELLVGIQGPLRARPDTIVRVPPLRLEPIRAIDPPVLIALLDTRALAFESAAS